LGVARSVNGLALTSSAWTGANPAGITWAELLPLIGGFWHIVCTRLDAPDRQAAQAVADFLRHNHSLKRK
jgi:hypothetical protein